MSAREFLDLLAREAGAEEFDAVVARAEAAGAGHEALAALEEARRVALRVRTTLRQRRRREAELVALYDTASDLARLRDLEKVLQAIVRRARSLLGADITYLSLVDPQRGDTYLRVTDGSVSARFQRVRLPLGTGLGGLVAQTHTPYATADYHADPRFRHTGDIDEAVVEEGLRAILGVPLTIGARSIGVLFAAHRTPRPFAPEEVALLSSLGSFAAVAIDNARLFAESAQSLAELTAATALLREHSAAVERAAESHDRLTDLVLRGGGVEEVAAAVRDLLGGWLAVLDDAGRTLAATGPAPAYDDGLARAVAASRSSGRAVEHAGLRVAAVAAGAEHLGALVLGGHDTVGPADLRVFERAVIVTAVLLLLRRSVAEAEQRVRGELVEDLLAATEPDPAALVERARLLGADLDAGHLVLVAVGPDDVRARLAAAAQRVAARRGGIAGELRGASVLLLPARGRGAGAAGPRADQAAAELGAAVGRAVTVGAAGPVASPFAEPAAARAAHGEARRCVDALTVLGRVGAGASAEELGFVGLLLGSRRDLAGYVRSRLGPVLDYDARRGTELVRTLEAWFRHGGGTARAAAELRVHPNTVTQRLDRVTSLLGAGWQEPDGALELQLALRLRALRHAPPPAGDGD